MKYKRRVPFSETRRAVPLSASKCLGISGSKAVTGPSVRASCCLRRGGSRAHFRKTLYRAVCRSCRPPLSSKSLFRVLLPFIAFSNLLYPSAGFLSSQTLRRRMAIYSRPGSAMRKVPSCTPRSSTVYVPGIDEGLPPGTSPRDFSGKSARAGGPVQPVVIQIIAAVAHHAVAAGRHFVPGTILQDPAAAPGVCVKISPRNRIRAGLSPWRAPPWLHQRMSSWPTNVSPWVAYPPRRAASQ